MISSPVIEFQTHGALRLAIFAPSRLGIVIAPTSDPLKSIPLRGSQAMSRDPSALMAVNGPMFSNCENQSLPPGNASYAASHCSILRAVHLDVARDVRSPGLSPVGMLISVLPDGTAVASACSAGRCATNGPPCSEVPPSAVVSVQLCPPLLADGRVLASPFVDADVVQRGGLFIMGDGRLAFARMATTMLGFANAVLAAGGRTGGYLDGGGSLRWALRDGSWQGASEDRPVGSWLVVGGAGGGMGALGWLATIAAVGLGVVVWRRSR